MLPLLFATLTSAGPMDGWAGSRWLVEIEATFPVQLVVSGPTANPPVLRAAQVSAVLTCPESQPSGKAAIFVTCTAESLAFRGSPQTDPGKRLAEYQTAFLGLAQALAGGTYEIKLKSDGRVLSVDYQEPPKTDPLTVAAARQLAADLLYGFSLGRDAAVADTAAWDESGSPLVRAPTQPMGQGATKIRHTPQTVEGKAVILSAGEGTFTSQYLSWGSGQIAGIGGVTTSSAEQTSRTGDTLLAERTFDALFDGVAIPAAAGQGPFQERLWAVTSTPKHDARDMSGVKGTPLRYAGRIARLAPDDKPELGSTGLVSAPGATFGELPAWTPMPLPW